MSERGIQKTPIPKLTTKMPSVTNPSPRNSRLARFAVSRGSTVTILLLGLFVFGLVSSLFEDATEPDHDAGWGLTSTRLGEQVASFVETIVGYFGDSVLEADQMNMDDADPLRLERAENISIPASVRNTPNCHNVNYETLDLASFNQEQLIHGFGGALVFYTNYIGPHPKKYDILWAIFNELQPSAIRLRNKYNQPNQYNSAEELIQIDRDLMSEASQRIKPAPRIMMASWSPPSYLKENNQLTGGNGANVLKRGADGDFDYQGFAMYWADSLREYHSQGTGSNPKYPIYPRWISIQNEPDYDAPGHFSSLFSPYNDNSKPNYFTAAERVHNYIRSQDDINFAAPGTIGPDTARVGSFVDAEQLTNPIFEAYASHLYGAGDQYSEEFFQNLPGSLTDARNGLNSRGVGNVFMTEHSNLKEHNYEDPIALSVTIYLTMKILKTNMYLHWDLMYGTGTGEGTLLLVENPFGNPNAGFYRTTSFHWFRHFTNFIRPGMRQTSCDFGDGGYQGLLVLCYAADKSVPSGGPALSAYYSDFDFGDSENRDIYSIIVINTSYEEHTIQLSGLPGNPSPDTQKRFSSTLDSGFQEDQVHAGGEWSLCVGKRSIASVVHYRVLRN